MKFSPATLMDLARAQILEKYQSIKDRDNNSGD